VKKKAESAAKARAILRIFYPDNIGGGVPQDHSSLEALKKLDGITNLQVNPITNKVRVEYDPSKVTLEEIQKMLRSI
jgi:Heavy-metal-associated domain